MDRTKFYTSLRRRESGVFGTKLSQRQVDGCETVLDECIAQRADLGQAAYILGRAYGETGGKMRPVEENLHYTTARRLAQVFSKSRRQGQPPDALLRNPEALANAVYGGAWGERNLGNVQPGDGWRFRGRGLGQITGRRNYGMWSQKLGFDFLEDPGLLMDLHVSAQALVQPMLEGWATGHKLSDFVEGARRDYLGANAVWNGNLDADKYVAHALAFEAALEAAGYAPQVHEPSAPPAPPAEMPAAPTGWLGALMAFLQGVLQGVFEGMRK